MAEQCGNGVDENCDGRADNCIINVDIHINGDCQTARCPADAPFPVGCNVTFSGGDCRGCVATDAQNTVYFQEGNSCGAGTLQGILRCSTEPGAGLNAANCPIHKEHPIYPGVGRWGTSRHGCPGEDDDDEECD